MRQTLASAVGAVITVCFLACPAAAAGARTCSVVLRVTEAMALGSLQLTLDYTKASGSFALNLQDKVDCTNDVLTAVSEFADNVDTRHLGATFISIDGFSGPATVAHCTFTDDSGTLVPEDFTVNVVDADAPGGAPLAKFPAVAVRLPDCSPNDSSTTTTTTTPVTTTDLPQMFCDVTLRMTTTATIGSLDWSMGYQNAPGEFAGSAGEVACVNLIPKCGVVFNDMEDQRKIRGGLISLDMKNGAATPADIASCQFLPASSDEPIASDFVVTVIQATDVAGVVLPTPNLKISQIQCVTPGTSTTTTLPEPLCGDADQDNVISASDALQILRRAVNPAVICPVFLCDTDSSGEILAGDALLALERAVGIPVVLNCPPQ